MTGRKILVIRLGAMGDVLHALPAVASLKKSNPESSLIWLIARKWLPLIAGNPYVDEIIPFEGNSIRSLQVTRGVLRPLRPDLAIDFQGLLKSAFAGRMAGARQFFGFDRAVAREPLASRLYSNPIHVTGPHRIERNLQLAAAAGATKLSNESWIPEGVAEGDLPKSPFVLASPFAGWQSKEWPLGLYDRLGRELKKEGLELVVNITPERNAELSSLANVIVHNSSIAGLIHATRKADAVIGVDSGPLHLASALRKPGVALFGPTDPAQTGPFNSPIRVLRQEDTATTYKRGRNVHKSMAAITVEQVREALMQSLAPVVRAG